MRLLKNVGVLFVFLMSTSMVVLSDNFIYYSNPIPPCNPSSLSSSFHNYNNNCHYYSSILVNLGGAPSARMMMMMRRRRRRRSLGGHLIPNARKGHSTWWNKFFFDDDGNWFGLKDEDMLPQEGGGLSDVSSAEEDLSETEKFEAWRRRAEAIVELKEAQQDMRNEENRRWEDWILDDPTTSSWVQDHTHGIGQSAEDFQEDLPDMIPRKGLAKSLTNFVLGREDDDLLYQDRVFQYASFNSHSIYGFKVMSPRSIASSGLSKCYHPGYSQHKLYINGVGGWLLCLSLHFLFNWIVNFPEPYYLLLQVKFLAILIIVPTALDFLVHDYVLLPFLERYVKTVPLAAQVFDVRRHQKLEMVKELKLDKAKYRLEVEIGKSPPLSDDELWLELRHKALELRDEWRLENRRAFANIWSDMVFGVSLFILLYFNQSKVALLKFTGYKIINNISDTGKAFLIILVTDIFLGYHSESGWQTLLEIIVEHYGVEVDQSAITIFVCLIPVIIDACVKLWMFKFLPRLSPKVANIFREMKRH